MAGRFAMVPVWVLEARLSGNAVKLFAVLARHDGPGGAYPSRARLAAAMGCSVDSIDRYLRELVAAGAITIEPRHDPRGDRTSSRYRIHFEGPGGGAAGVGETSATGGRSRAATGGGGDAARTRSQANEIPLNDPFLQEGGATRTITSAEGRREARRPPGGEVEDWEAAFARLGADTRGVMQRMRGRE